MEQRNIHHLHVDVDVSLREVYLQSFNGINYKGFSQWKSFLSKDIFEEEYGEFVPSSVQELLCLTDCSLLRKSINMLQYHFALNGDSLKLKNRLKLFKSIWPTLALLQKNIPQQWPI
ncbi:hypothetical protein RYX36_008083 [Vicia faba]